VYETAYRDHQIYHTISTQHLLQHSNDKMDDDRDRNPDRLPSEPPEFSSNPTQQHGRTGSMSLGAPPNANGDDVSPINGDAPTHSAPLPAQMDPHAKAVNDVVNSEVRFAVGAFVRGES
jgi:hypothetical protein